VTIPRLIIRVFARISVTLAQSARNQNEMATNLGISCGIKVDAADGCLKSIPADWFNQLSKAGAYTF